MEAVYKKESNYHWPHFKSFPSACSSAIVLRQANSTKAQPSANILSILLVPISSSALSSHLIPFPADSMIFFRSFQEILIAKIWVPRFSAFYSLDSSVLFRFALKSLCCNQATHRCQNMLLSCLQFASRMPLPFLSTRCNLTWTLRPSSRSLGSLKSSWMASAPGDFSSSGILWRIWCNSANISCYNLGSPVSL